jgi:hypothetical protein
MKRPATKGLYAAVRKYGREAFKVEELEACSSRKNLHDREIALIAQHKTLAPDGYNLHTGGPAHCHTAETKSYIGAPNIGKSHSPERCRNISEAKTKRRFSYKGEMLSAREIHERYIPAGSSLTLALLKARLMICHMEVDRALTQHVISRPRS